MKKLPVIKCTKDYGMFKKIPGNRPVREAHVKRLMNSFDKKYLISPIQVNKNMGVVDGQTRLEAAKRMNLPVYYFEDGDGGLTDVHLINSCMENFKKIEFLDSYCVLGLKPYMQLKDFMKTYPDFSVGTSESILKNSHYEKEWLKDEEGKPLGRRHCFKEGLFEIPDLGQAYENAGKIMEYKQYFEGFYQTSFIRALIRIFKNPKFNNDLMIAKLKLQPRALVPCTSIKEYVNLIEEIYNYRNQKKINLRFS
jgi:hypothetical protein